MFKDNKNEHANALKELKYLCTEFEFTAGIIKYTLTGELNKND